MNCNVGWVEKCGIQTIDATIDRFTAGEEEFYTPDNWTSQTGEIYFYSPEQLDGDKARRTSATCTSTATERRSSSPLLTAASPAVRMKSRPTAQHMAFVTSAPNITGYENQGSKQMYLYEPEANADRTG